MRLSKGPMLDLQRMVATADMHTVVQALATIARDKAVAVADNGDARAQAERWDLAARQLERCADSAEVLAISR